MNLLHKTDIRNVSFPEEGYQKCIYPRERISEMYLSKRKNIGNVFIPKDIY